MKNIPAYADAERAARAAKYDKKNDAQDTVSIIVPAEKGRSEEMTLPLSEYCALIADCARALSEKK